MIEGVFNLEVIEDGLVVKTARLHNTVLDNGLKAIIGSGGTASLSDRSWITIGSGTLDISYKQTKLVAPFFEKFGTTYTFESNEPDKEYAVFSTFVDIARTEAVGEWSEIGIGRMGGNINRCLFVESGTLQKGIYRYAVSSVNHTGESVLSDIVTVDIAQDNGIARISWSNPSGTSQPGRDPQRYNIYREVNGQFLRVKSIGRDDSKLYFYDRGEDIPSGTHNHTSIFLRKLENISGTYIPEPTQKPFVKTDMQEVKIRIDFYIGNQTEIHYRKDHARLGGTIVVEH